MYFVLKIYAMIEYNIDNVHIFILEFFETPKFEITKVQK
jgi:hypothetical protein